MTHNELTWKFLNEFDVESSTQAQARAISLEHGLNPISPAVGAQLALVAAATNATNMIEIGTGCGLSGLWLLSGAPEATLTSIDPEFEYHEQAREFFTEAGFPASRVRLITGKALDVLPRMNENSYDVVLVDGDPNQVEQNVEHALRLVRVGGTVLVPHVLHDGEVANPAKRTAAVNGLRAVLTAAQESENIVAALSPAGDGLLQFTKIS
ncbi:O-methyltransferase [Aurantimicrobium sp. MWH-Uga1]|uniref:O-methyltransferase n=1 Tax=Aurantimicrobium sp. MWH-Uga1 TaxID=2079575 RepID=UPI000DEDC553|nr:class I SAM-dependent methyltransferase [Aurantimicrobium sp. MWH-Uga1]AXE54201.1 Putative O-methyltransferase [Aurantimicrobium sp. MWH-Uga1]